MQLSAIRDRARSLAGIRSAALLTDAEIDEYVNEFNRSLCELYAWPQFSGSTTFQWPSTVSSRYTYPSDARNITSISVSDHGRFIQLRSVSSLEWVQLRDDVVGLPELYLDSPAGRFVDLWPQPVAGVELQVDYHKNPTTLTLDTDAPPFDVEYRLAWPLAAAITALTERGGDTNKIAALTVRLNDIVGRMRRRYLMGRDQAPMPMPRRW